MEVSESRRRMGTPTESPLKFQLHSITIILMHKSQKSEEVSTVVYDVYVYVLLMMFYIHIF
jgi:hypothetical protein